MKITVGKNTGDFWRDKLPYFDHQNISLLEVWCPGIAGDNTLHLAVEFPCLHRPSLEARQVFLERRLLVVFLKPAFARTRA